MKTSRCWRGLQAAFIGVAIVGSTTIARADIKDYKFEFVDQTVQAGPDKVIAVRLMNTKIGKPVPIPAIFGLVKGLRLCREQPSDSQSPRPASKPIEQLQPAPEPAE